MLLTQSCASVTSRTMGTVDLPSRLSVLRFAARCCIGHAVTWLPISARLQVCSHCTHFQTGPHETLHRFLAGSSWECNRRQYKIRQILEVSGLAFIEAQRSNCTKSGRLDSNIRRKGDTVLPCPQHSRSQPQQKSRQEHLYSSSSLFASEQSHSQQELSA